MLAGVGYWQKWGCGVPLCAYAGSVTRVECSQVGVAVVHACINTNGGCSRGRVLVGMGLPASACSFTMAVMVLQGEAIGCTHASNSGVSGCACTHVPVG